MYSPVMTIEKLKSSTLQTDSGYPVKEFCIVYKRPTEKPSSTIKLSPAAKPAPKSKGATRNKPQEKVEVRS